MADNNQNSCISYKKNIMILKKLQMLPEIFVKHNFQIIIIQSYAQTYIFVDRNFSLYKSLKKNVIAVV